MMPTKEKAMDEELVELLSELEKVKSSSSEYLPEYGYMSKKEIIELIEADIKDVEDSMSEYESDYTDEELEHERTQLCMSLGISRYC